MPLFTYTTQISVDKTLHEIQMTLIKHGAKKILTDVEDGMITSLSFMISIDGQDVPFKLPNEWKAVLRILNADKKVPGRLKTNEQALRVSWRILKVWLDAQMAIIETKMVKIEEVFLPYVIQSNGKTLYQSIESGENKGLLLK